MPKDKLFLITGDDTASIETEARKLVNGLAGDTPDAFTLEVFKPGDDRPPEDVVADLIGAILTPSLLGGDKTLWLKLTAFSDIEGTRALETLISTIDNGLPPDVALVISGPGADGRKRLTKICGEQGTVKQHKKPDMRKFKWREEMTARIREHARERDIKLAPQVVEYLIEAIGVETGRVGPELDKLTTYAGNEPTLEQAQDVCAGQRGAVFYALSNALGDRDMKKVFDTIPQLLSNSRNPNSTIIGLVRQASRQFRMMLHAKLLMAYLKVRHPDGLPTALGRMDDAQKITHRNNQLLDMREWQAKLYARQAANFEGAELVNALELLADADRALVSTGTAPRVILEQLVVSIVGPTCP